MLISPIFPPRSIKPPLSYENSSLFYLNKRFTLCRYIYSIRDMNYNIGAWQIIISQQNTINYWYRSRHHFWQGIQYRYIVLKKNYQVWLQQSKLFIDNSRLALLYSDSSSGHLNVTSREVSHKSHLSLNSRTID